MRAIYLLDTSEYSVTDIGFICGFESMSTFMSAFRKRFGVLNIGKTMYVNFYVFMIRLCISIQRFYRKKDLSHVLMIFMREQHILSLKILLNQLRDRAKSLSEL